MVEGPGQKDRYHQDPVSERHRNDAPTGHKHDIGGERGVGREFGDGGVEVAHGVTSILKDLGHAGADIGLAVAHGVTGSLSDAGHAVENVGRAFETEETLARHDAHHNERVDRKYGEKIARDEYRDERTAERAQHHVEHKEAGRARHVEHLKDKGKEPYKIENAQKEAEHDNAHLEAKEAHKVGKEHLKESRKEAKARVNRLRKQR
ncbi:hypothetical protein [Arthrobacter sp. SDTb3-6]|uniref:hypothetical protein n=1 Tax=Arthrobacter sp. SDTb3-6 TaxID=2713571 RepID=UPI00159CFFDD|nr:hypothetical protein [Arthrobacter sp. SDTb3-6]NVM97632.1 hypothetical protein [Arthrobacter sp. SDTb3-6]